jgi:hypothetical protein
MDESTTPGLTDDDIRTVMPGSAETGPGDMPGDTDGTDAGNMDGTDTRDTDGTDAAS